MTRRKSRDRWPELCDRVSNDDGLEVRDVGPWSAEKVYVWNRYLEITTTAMVGKPQWPAGLTYIDLFAGPGVSRIKGRGDRIPGSPLLAAWTPKPFQKLILCEKDPEAAAACRTRLQRLSESPDCSFFVGDCNVLITDIVKAVPSRSLSVALIDPTGLHAHLDTICRLSDCGQVDLLVLFSRCNRRCSKY